MSDMQILGFPTRRGRTFGWAPILFQPIQYSPERLIIGVAVVERSSVHLLRANRLDKLACLFGDAAEDAIFAAEVALQAIEHDFLAGNASIIQGYSASVSGVSIGELREAEGEHWLEVAERWFSASSAMFQKSEIELLSLVPSEVANAVAMAPSVPAPRERLPSLVAEYVTKQRPSLRSGFSPSVFGRVEKRHPADPKIDFRGFRVNANFATLFANRTTSVDRIKRRMWDLKVLKERAEGNLFDQRFEMFVQHPRRDDPQVSDAQQKRLMESINVLEGEADTVEIRLRPLTSVEEIGDFLLAAEAA